MTHLKKRRLCTMLIGVCPLLFTNFSQANNNDSKDDIEVIQLKIIGYSNEQDEVDALEPEKPSYFEELNLTLEADKVPFRYLTYDSGDGKFTTYPFNLINETLPTMTGPNPNYDQRYDKAFQKMIAKLTNDVDLANKSLYAMGSQAEGLYIQDINTHKKYVLYKICFDNKCAAGQVFYIFNPENYDMAGILYDGCSFLKGTITGNDMRTRILLRKYIDAQDPLSFSYAPNACKKQLLIEKGK